MKKLLSLLVAVMCANLFALDFSSVKEGDTKKSVVKNLGRPFKTVTSADPKNEICLWIDGKDIWMVSFTEGKADANASTIDDLLSSLLDLKAIFSEFDDSSGKERSAPEKKESASVTPPPVDQSLKDKVEITVTECKVFNKNSDQTAGYRLKVKNRSEKEITKLSIIFYFYDKEGKVFFEDSCALVSPDSYSLPKKIKPNYSLLIPDSSYMFCSVPGMDITEWDEGKYSFEITELE